MLVGGLVVGGVMVLRLGCLIYSGLVALKGEIGGRLSGWSGVYGWGTKE